MRTWLVVASVPLALVLAGFVSFIPYGTVSMIDAPMEMRAPYSLVNYTEASPEERALLFSPKLACPLPCQLSSALAKPVRAVRVKSF
jgi:hypothetical protein